MGKKSVDSLTSIFVKQIEKKIISGEWFIGLRLPTSRELTKIFNVSRSVVNAGMVELASKGFVKIVPRKWTEVVDYQKEGTIAVLESIMEYRGDKIDEHLLLSVLEARMLVEKQCAYFAALRCSKEDLALLDKIIKKEVIYNKNPKDNIDNIISNDFLFHHAIAVASKNSVYPLLIKSFETVFTKFTKQFYSHIDVGKIVYSYHFDLIQALKNRDSEKSQDIMEKLLLHGEDVIKLDKKVWKI